MLLWVRLRQAELWAGAWSPVGFDAVSLLLRFIIAALLSGGLLSVASCVLRGRMLRAAVAAAAVVAVFVVSPPDAYWRVVKGRVCTDVDGGLLEEFLRERGFDGGGRSLVCFFSTRCGHCRDFAGKLRGVLSRAGAGPQDVYLFFLDFGEGTQAEAEGFVEECLGGLRCAVRIEPPEEMLPVTRGVLSVVFLTDGCSPLREYDVLSFDEREASSFLSCR